MLSKIPLRVYTLGVVSSDFSTLSLAGPSRRRRVNGYTISGKANKDFCSRESPFLFLLLLLHLLLLLLLLVLRFLHRDAPFYFRSAALSRVIWNAIVSVRRFQTSKCAHTSSSRSPARRRILPWNPRKKHADRLMYQQCNAVRRSFLNVGRVSNGSSQSRYFDTREIEQFETNLSVESLAGYSFLGLWLYDVLGHPISNVVFRR